ncbi:thioredoxin [Candidatus Desantisbacteria bacterium]|nr:thioredoxin [Candidatus Desantisbacteria bacterium]
MSGENLINFTDANFEEEALKADILVIVDFWAPWCGPCRMVGPLVEELAREYKGKIKVGKFNVDENSQIPARYRIRSIPTIMFFKNGQMVKEIVGAVPKHHIANAIKENM